MFMNTIAVGPFDDVESCVTGGTAVVAVVAVAIALLGVCSGQGRRHCKLGRGIFINVDVVRLPLQRTEYGVRKAMVKISFTQNVLPKVKYVDIHW